jgi:hypothetical protein
MKYRSLEQIAPDADVHLGLGMSRRERLERRAELLEQQPNRRLSTIEGTENARPSVLTIPRSPWRSKTRCCVLRGSGATGLATRSSSSTSGKIRCITWSATVITGRRYRPAPLPRACG